MAGFKAPDFTERAAAARDAKQRALEALRNKPAPDPEAIAARQAKLAEREAAAAERRAARLAEAEAAKAAKEAARAEAEAARIAAAAPPVQKPKLNEAEMKALRDARYAARKARKK